MLHPARKKRETPLCLCVSVNKDKTMWGKSRRLMSGRHRGKKSQLCFCLLTTTNGCSPRCWWHWVLYTNETKGFVKDPNHSGSDKATTLGKYTANEAQRALSAQQEENYNVIPTFNIITIFIALFAGLLLCVQSEYVNFKLIINNRCISKHPYYFFLIIVEEFPQDCLVFKASAVNTQEENCWSVFGNMCV